MLTDKEVRDFKSRTKPYKVADGCGLFIVVSPNGNKHWRFKYFFGSEKSISFGKYPTIGLSEARGKRFAAEELIRQNIDPSIQRKIERQSALIKYGNTLQDITAQWYEVSRSRWTPRHAKKVWQRLEIHVLPFLGGWPIAQIKPMDLLAVLRKIETTGATETAHRTLWTCNQIFKFAVIIGAIENNSAANIGGGLIAHRGKGRPVLPIQELPGFLRRLENGNIRELDRLATKLLMLTVLRTGELRRCRWSDIRPANCELRVRPEVMKIKDGYEHIVPLSRQAVAILGKLYRLTGHQEWLFPNSHPLKNPYISENVINNAIADLGYKGRMVGHSFRKLFSTILNEHEFHAEAIERQLAHVERNKVRAAYNHAKYLTARRELMQWWADYLEGVVKTAIAPSVANYESIELFLLGASQQSHHLKLPA